MGKFMEKLDNDIVYGGIFYFVLGVGWLAVSILLNLVSKPNQEIKAFLESKVLFMALTFLGKYLFFPYYRSPKLAKLLLPLIFVISLLTLIGKLSEESVWLFYVLLILDSLFWTYFVAGLLETLILMIERWWNPGEIEPNQVAILWLKFWTEQLKIGFLITVASCLSYFYLSNCFLIDTVFYSYLLVMPLLVVAIALFLNLFYKIQSGINRDLRLIDEELSSYLSPAILQEQLGFAEQLPWVQYLFQLRTYLYFAKKPVLSIATIGCYFIYAFFILALPYLFGIIAEV